MLVPDWVNNSNFRLWRQELRRKLFFERGGVSDLSGKSLKGGFHMHEGIITRATVPASIVWHHKIYAPCNCFLLLPEEHIPQPPTREWALKRAYQMYGDDAVLEWLNSLPFKVKPFVYRGLD